MANPVKKNKKIATNDKKFNPFSSHSKREKIIAIVFFAALIILLGIGAYAQYAAKTDKDNVIMMRKDVRSIVKKMQSVDGEVKWADISHCTIHEPRLFGDEIRYTCDASYEGSIEVNEDQDIKNVINDNYSILQASSRVDSTIDIYPSINKDVPSSENINRDIKSIDFVLFNVPSAKCDMNYIVTQQDVTQLLKLYIRCYQSTKKAYFEPIKQT